MFSKHNVDEHKQRLILSALRYTTDPKKLKLAAGISTVAELHRVIDKMSLRKEYHTALARHGITFDFIAGGLKEEAKNPQNKGGDRIKALGILLKSLGVADYKEEGPKVGGSWEDVLLKKIEENKASKAQGEEDEDGDDEEDFEYEVSVPAIPESVKKLKLREKEAIGEIGIKSKHYE
jgi:hypothetical protein